MPYSLLYVVPHGYEQQFQFEFFPLFAPNANDLKVSTLMGKLITNFAKTGYCRVLIYTHVDPTSVLEIQICRIHWMQNGNRFLAKIQRNISAFCPIPAWNPHSTGTLTNFTINSFNRSSRILIHWIHVQTQVFNHPSPLQLPPEFRFQIYIHLYFFIQFYLQLHIVSFEMHSISVPFT